MSTDSNTARMGVKLPAALRRKLQKYEPAIRERIVATIKTRMECAHRESPNWDDISYAITSVILGMTRICIPFASDTEVVRKQALEEHRAGKCISSETLITRLLAH